MQQRDAHDDADQDQLEQPRWSDPGREPGVRQSQQRHDQGRGQVDPGQAQGAELLQVEGARRRGEKDVGNSLEEKQQQQQTEQPAFACAVVENLGQE
jgi:hypothetical protein